MEPQPGAPNNRIADTNVRRTGITVEKVKYYQETIL
jgi:hypothetical protein